MRRFNETSRPYNEREWANNVALNQYKHPPRHPLGRLGVQEFLLL